MNTNLRAFARIGLFMVFMAGGERIAAPFPSPERSKTRCSASEYRQFDFWIGDWDVFDVSKSAKVAHAQVDSILSGCVLREDYQSINGHKGQSFTIYDATRKLWHQSWVTNDGQLLEIEGKAGPDGIVLSGRNQNGALVRGTWQQLNGEVRETAVTSSDDGAIWQAWFDLIFRPASAASQAEPPTAPDQDIHPVQHDPHLSDFQVIEFRRYLVKDEQRKQFAQYFESYFPEAFQQLGAIAAGSFFERKNASGFTWIRGFHTVDDRAVVNGEFYYGSVWNEHRDKLNGLIADSDNVILLRPLSSIQGVPVLPAVDPVSEPEGAQGVVVAQIFAVQEGSVDAFAREAAPAFAKYRVAGAHEAGVLVSLNVKNNFPQLAIRSDGPYLVWLGILKDNQALEKSFAPAAEQALASFQATGLLRSAPELVVLDPTPRSRLRWLSSWK